MRNLTRGFHGAETKTIKTTKERRIEMPRKSKPKAKSTKKCDCLFCNSKCPGCGSPAISVLFAPWWEYSEPKGDQISITRAGYSIQVDCLECNNRFEINEYSRDERLVRLGDILDDLFETSDGVEVERRENGEIEVTPTWTISTPREK